MTRWRAIAPHLTLFFALGMALAAAPTAARTQAASQVQDSATLRWSGPGRLSPALDPHGPAGQRDGSMTRLLLHQIYEPLVRRRQDGGLEGALARDWRQETPTRWRFTVRKGVQFHDGTPLHADDVVFSIARARMDQSSLHRELTGITKVRALGAQAIEIETDRVRPLLPERLALVPILSRAWAGRTGMRAIRRAGENDRLSPDILPSRSEAAGEDAPLPNGTGAYRVLAHDPNAQTVLAENASWWGGALAPYAPRRLIYRPMPDPAARLAALTAGDLDLIFDLPARAAGLLRRSPGVRLESTPTGATMVLGLQQSGAGAPFADRRVRAAIDRAINVTALTRVILRGAGDPAGIPVHGAVSEYRPSGPDRAAASPALWQAANARTAHDLVDARRLLAEAGVAEGFEVTLDCPKGRYAFDTAVCEAVAGMVGRIGIRVRVAHLDAEDHFFRILNRQSPFYLLASSPSTFDGGPVLESLVHSRGQWNGTGYASPHADALIDTLLREQDAPRRHALARQAWDMVKDDVVYVPLYHARRQWARSDQVQLKPGVGGLFRFHETAVRPF